MSLSKKYIENIYYIFFCFISVIRLLTLYYPELVFIDLGLIQSIYIIFSIILLCLIKKNNIYDTPNKNIKVFICMYLILFIHAILFRFVLYNPINIEYTRSFFLSYFIYLIVIFFSVIFILKTESFEKFIKYIFFTISIYLMIQFVIHLKELNLSNILNIFSTTLRSRETMGFTHPNHLGNYCLCQIIVAEIFKKIKPKYKIISNIMIITSILMVLSSASRSSLTAILVYFIFYYILYYYRYKISTKDKKIVNIITIYTTIAIFLFLSAYNLNFDNLLQEANRDIIFEQAIPTFLNSGRTICGLGMAGNDIYGNNLTGYKTYYLDNGYIYWLITTGYLGFALILSFLLILTKRISNKKDDYLYFTIISSFIAYLYASLFEATLLYGHFANLLFLIIFCAFGYDKTRKRKD